MTAHPTPRRAAVVALAFAALAACGPHAPKPQVPVPVAARQPTLAHAIVPMPMSVQMVPADTFDIDTLTKVVIAADASPEIERIARGVARMIGRDTIAGVWREPAGTVDTASNIIRLWIHGPATGEGYTLESDRGGVVIAASTPEGLYYGVQTLRQLMPVSVEHPDAFMRRLRVPGAKIADQPRYAWRGSMLDVSRHFLPIEAVKRHVDAMALYKLNRLHLHLSDDQGWRIEIKSRPALTQVGGSTQVGGGVGGYYTQAQFADLVRYAAERYVAIVPEFDMPGHTNAALASTPALNCDGKAPPLYTGIKVGFSAVCVTSDTTYKWIDDVVREIGPLVPTPWFHMGGDEVQKLTHQQYLDFVSRADSIVRSHGKTTIGWAEIAPARIDPSTIVQSWRGLNKDSSAAHVARGGKVIMSPGPKLYIDMKYDSTTILGLRWAGIIPVRATYDWDPATYLTGVPESAILGVEAPLWSETLVKYADFQYLAFPRLLAVAELGWTPQASRDWEEFRLRLVPQGQRLQALGVNFHRSPEVNWVP